MAYVLNYTIIAAGLPYQAQGVSHGDALMSFIAQPAGLTAGYRKGRLEVGDGERIIVVGLSQEAYSDHQSALRRVQHLREALAKRGRGRPPKSDPWSDKSKAELTDLLAEAEREVNEPQQETIAFTMRAVTRFKALTDEEIERENELYSALRRRLHDAIQLGTPVELKVNYERQHPIGDLLKGVPQDLDDDGVWMHNKLIPFTDIDEVVPHAEEVTA